MLLSSPEPIQPTDRAKNDSIDGQIDAKSRLAHQHSPEVLGIPSVYISRTFSSLALSVYHLYEIKNFKLSLPNVLAPYSILNSLRNTPMSLHTVNVGTIRTFLIVSADNWFLRLVRIRDSDKLMIKYFKNPYPFISRNNLITKQLNNWLLFIIASSASSKQLNLDLLFFYTIYRRCKENCIIDIHKHKLQLHKVHN